MKTSLSFAHETTTYGQKESKKNHCSSKSCNKSLDAHCNADKTFLSIVFYQTQWFETAIIRH